MDLEEKQQELPLEIVKRTLVVEQLEDDTYRCNYVGIVARQHLLPMLRAAEKQFRIKLNREALKPLAIPASPAEKGEVHEV